MARLYADGGAKKRITADYACARQSKPPSGLVVDWRVNERCDTLVIDGHVDLAKAAEAMCREGGAGFSEPRHTWMRYGSVPDGELNESDEPGRWYGECQHGDKGAEPVTIAVRNT